MKDYTKAQLEESRPSNSALHCVEFCLKRLYADRTRATSDECVKGMTYEELIGALLLARDELGGWHAV